MEEHELHPAAIATAEWWAEKMGMATGNGDQSDLGGIVMALALISGRQGVNVEASKKDLFVAALARTITRQFNRTLDKPKWPVTLGVDYGPDQELANAADFAGIPSGSFPWKTVSWTYTTHLVVSLGYGGREELIWNAEDWQRPLCHRPEYSGPPEYKRKPWICSKLRYHQDGCDFSISQPLCIALVGRTEKRVCNQPENGDWHQKDEYPSPLLHEFTMPLPKL